MRLFLQDRFPSIDRAARIRCPVLVIAGNRDTVVPIDQTRRFYDAVTVSKTFVEIAGADHNDDELLAGGGVQGEKGWAFMIDQASGRENRIMALLHSIDSLQLSLAKGLLVDRERLAQFQQEDDIISANRVFNDALMNADARPVVAKARLHKGLPLDPVQAFRESQYQEKIERARSVVSG